MNKFFLKKLAATTLLLFGFGGFAQAQVSESEATQIRSAIGALVNEYAVARDSNDAVAYANTFAENGIMSLYGNELTRDQLRERVESSDPRGVSMHHMATAQINIINDKIYR